MRTWLPLSCLVTLVLLGHPADLWCAPSDDPHAKWEPELKALEAADATNTVPAQPIVFVGSSSIRMWKSLASDFKGIPVLNRGFGGSQIDDSVYFAERLVLRYHPRQVVIYAGDNDLAAGKSPERLLADFQAFVRKVHAALPQAPITFIAVKPSPSRWRLAGQVREANRLIAEFTRTDPQLSFVDVFTPMLGQDGQPRPELFAADRLHMNAKGYALWRELIRPYLKP